MNICKKIDEFLTKIFDCRLNKKYPLIINEEIEVKDINREFINNIYFFISGLFVGMLWKDIDFMIFSITILISIMVYVKLSIDVMCKKWKLEDRIEKRLNDEKLNSNENVNNNKTYILKNELLFTNENLNKEINK